MHDCEGSVIYIGMSRNLRQRISSYRYLRPERASRKSIRLIHAVERITWETCANPREAELRENLLLRTCRPKFNRIGTYPAAYSFVVAQRLHHHLLLRLTRHEVLWGRRYGAFKPSVSRSFAALHRWLWIHIHCPAATDQLPAGFLDVRPREIAIDIAHPAGPDLCTEVQSFLEGESDALVRREIPSPLFASGFGKALFEADAEVLRSWLVTCSRQRQLRQKHGLTAGIPNDALDDLLTVDRAERRNETRRSESVEAMVPKQPTSTTAVAPG